MKKALKLTGKILLIAISSVLALVVLFLAVLNVAKFAIYSDYYSIKDDVCKNPGLSDGFVCQGICAYEDAEKIFVSGYMKDHSPSRIYVTDENDESYYVSVYYGSGKEFTGHAGGVAVTGNYVYIASGDNIYAIPVSSLLEASDGDKVSITKIIPVNNEASFVYADDKYIYVGEFHDGNAYVTDHPYDTPDGKYFAIVSRYTVESIEGYSKAEGNVPTPDKVYSIRNKVQGICFTPDGQVVLSTSYGVADTVYYIYNEGDAIDSGKTLDGAPVYYLNSPQKEIHGPAMGEDLDYYNGKILTLTESASNKYIFGKFFFANKIVTLDINDLDK